MVKKFKIGFFSIFQHGLQPCPIHHDKLIGPGFNGFGDKKFCFVIFFSFSRQEYVLKIKHLKFLTQHYSGASVSEVPNE